jgi:hypothetical protein
MSFGEHANDRCHFPHRVSFVKMNPALCENDFGLLDFAENESADLTGHRRLRDF